MVKRRTRSHPGAGRARRARRSIKETRVRRRNLRARTAIQQRDRERALKVLADMRHKRMSLSVAAARWGIAPDTVSRYVGSALLTIRGQSRPTKFDRIPRALNFFTSQGRIAVTVRDSRTASLIAEYMNAVGSRDVSALARFSGLSFQAGGIVHGFVTDVDLLDRLDDAGLITIEGLYRSIQGGQS